MPASARSAAVMPLRAASPGLNGRDCSVWSLAQASSPDAWFAVSPKAFAIRC